MPDFIIPCLFIIDGIACMLLAIFAHEIGLDPTTIWGRGRFILLFFLAWDFPGCVFHILARNVGGSGQDAL